jgi:8-oxo-dGTP pyrophosphatase MutT (NUDIX family)
MASPIEEYEETLAKPLRQATLCLLFENNKILLAMKKRGFGKGKWNGVGGKPDSGESIEEAAIREAKEEIDVTPTNLKKVATLNFYFPEVDKSKGFDQQVIVYLVDKWTGTPIESEEMFPKWFGLEEIPYNEMWPDDSYWLPKVLAGKEVNARFLFGNTDSNAVIKDVIMDEI